MAEHPLCHRRVSQSFFPAMCFFLCEKRKGKFWTENERKKERKKERKNTKRVKKKNADGHVVTIVFTTHE